MLKLALIGCLCSALLVKGQGGPPPPPDGAPPPPDGAPPPPNGPPNPVEHMRVARQSMPMPPGMQEIPNMQGGNPGNLGMQGLGNFPDPTAVIAKAQEVGRQFMNGRRRRQLTTTMPQMP